MVVYCCLQVTAISTERDSLAQQNASLAQAFSRDMADKAEKAELSGQPASPGPTPAQMKEIGTLMQRLTRENAGLMKARDSAAAERDMLLEQQKSWKVRGQMLWCSVHNDVKPQCRGP